MFRCDNCQFFHPYPPADRPDQIIFDADGVLGGGECRAVPPVVQEFDQLLFPLSRRLELDSAGRLRLPDRMMERAAIGKDVVLIGVDYVDTPAGAFSYLRKFKITFPNAPDLQSEISSTLNRKLGVPETYFIDKHGILRYVQVGPFATQQEAAAAREKIKALGIESIVIPPARTRAAGR